MALRLSLGRGGGSIVASLHSTKIGSNNHGA
jgi:hypothetical protein